MSKVLLLASALALSSCVTTPREWATGVPEPRPEPPTRPVGFGSVRDTGADTIVVDGAFAGDQRDLAQRLVKSGRRYAILDVRRGATWESLSVAHLGATGGGAATVRVRREGEPNELTLRASLAQTAGGWLTLEFTSDSIMARVWPIEGAPGVTEALPSERSRWRAWLQRNCRQGRCGRILILGESSLPATRGIDIAGALLDAWPFSVAPVVLPGAMKPEWPALHSATGALPPIMIQAVVRASFQGFRVCYERGLAKEPKLTGLVSVKFKILPSGSVVDASDGGNEGTLPPSLPPIPDEQVKACVIKSFGALRFPMFEGNPITIIYPLMLAPA